MTEAATRSRIKELRALAIGWAAKADRAAEVKHFRDAQQHLRRANELVLEANRLEQNLTAD